jgi:hypothetical protein
MKFAHDDNGAGLPAFTFASGFADDAGFKR